MFLVCDNPTKSKILPIFLFDEVRMAFYMGSFRSTDRSFSFHSCKPMKAWTCVVDDVLHVLSVLFNRDALVYPLNGAI